MKTVSTKKALLMSVLSVLVCFTMLLGTTFAWFTDSVTSANNKIIAGNLKIDLELLDKATGNWNSIKDSKAPLFSEDSLWEPGYTEVKILKVENEGSLALKWKATFSSDVALSDLADVLDVYVKVGQSSYPERADLAGWTKAGTVREFVEGIESTTYGTLTAKGTADAEAYLGLAVKMREEAGNHYQNMSIGAFDITILATQLASEEDSFGIDYDALADYDGEISNVTSLQSAFDQGGNFKVIDSFTVPAGVLPTIPEGKTVALDLNGNSITAENSATEYAFNNLGNLTLWDSKASSATTYRLRSSAAGSVTARGIYNGYGNGGEHVPSAKLTILSGVYNAMGTNGGAAVFNYGIADIQGGNFTSVGGYTLNNQSTGTMTVSDVTVANGIYNLGNLAVSSGEFYNGISGRHTVYNAGTAIISGGTFENTSNNEVVYGAGETVTINGGTFIMNVNAFIIGGSNITINGGNFIDGDKDALRTNDGITINGGTFNFVPDSKYLSDGLKTETIGDTTYILPESYQTTAYSGLYTDGAQTYYVYTAEGFAGLNEMMNNKTAGKNVNVELCSDIDMAGKTWTPVDSHADTAFTFAGLNGNGHAIQNLTINGQAMFTRFSGFGDVTIKDITFDGATVNSGAINTSILTVQSYQNVLLDNVDILNSSITGAYKVAPFIATVYNEKPSTVTATFKNCDVFNTTVTATVYDFCTTGMVAFVYASDNDKVEFENCSVTDVKLCAPDDRYKAHAAVYTTGSSTLYDVVDGVTVTNCTFTNP